MNETDQLAEAAVSRINQRITDEVFLEIQGDRELMRTYLSLVEKNGSSAVNRGIGKYVKRRFNLIDADRREDAPKSTLIYSHQIFE